MIISNRSVIFVKPYYFHASIDHDFSNAYEELHRYNIHMLSKESLVIHPRPQCINVRLKTDQFLVEALFSAFASSHTYYTKTLLDPQKPNTCILLFTLAHGATIDTVYHNP